MSRSLLEALRDKAARVRILFVSVRSGAKFSMPGMMDTILTGLNDRAQALAKRQQSAVRG
jgi:hypothetical protein